MQWFYPKIFIVIWDISFEPYFFNMSNWFTLYYDVIKLLLVRFIKGVLFVCFIWGKAAVPAAVSSMLNAMQSLDVAVRLWIN